MKTDKIDDIIDIVIEEAAIEGICQNYNCEAYISIRHTKELKDKIKQIIFEAVGVNYGGNE